MLYKNALFWRILCWAFLFLFLAIGVAASLGYISTSSKLAFFAALVCVVGAGVSFFMAIISPSLWPAKFESESRSLVRKGQAMKSAKAKERDVLEREQVAAHRAEVATRRGIVTGEKPKAPRRFGT